MLSLRQLFQLDYALDPRFPSSPHPRHPLLLIVVVVVVVVVLLRKQQISYRKTTLENSIPPQEERLPDLSSSSRDTQMHAWEAQPVF